MSHEGVAHLLVEGGGEKFDHVSETREERGTQVTIIPQSHQEGAECTVDQLNVGLTMICHELYNHVQGGKISRVFLIVKLGR